MKSLDGRRLVIAHNPHSTRAAAVQEHVFGRLDKAGYTYETIEVRQASLEDNVTRLASLIRPGDIILSVAGDGSAHAVFHSVLAANQLGVELGFLAFGNFNDIPHTFNGGKSRRDPVAFLAAARPETVWPLAVHINDQPLRNALLYVTFGWTARAAGQFDDPKLRRKLRQDKASLARSVSRLMRYYLRSRRGGLLPPFRIGESRYESMTDILCANGPTVARLFRSGKRYYQGQTFLFRTLDVRRLMANTPFLASGLLGRMKGDVMTAVTLDFDTPANVPVQCDGEVVELQGVRRIEVQKSAHPLTILTTKQ